MHATFKSIRISSYLDCTAEPLKTRVAPITTSVDSFSFALSLPICSKSKITCDRNSKILIDVHRRNCHNKYTQ